MTVKPLDNRMCVCVRVYLLMYKCMRTTALTFVYVCVFERQKLHTYVYVQLKTQPTLSPYLVVSLTLMCPSRLLPHLLQSTTRRLSVI